MTRPRLSARLRRRIAEAARYRCGYCLTQEAVVGIPLEIDHIVPLARGGQSDEANLWLACTRCNDHKSDRVDAPDPESGEEVPLFDPRRQTWRDHFEWVDDGTIIRGITSVGRATVVALAMNDPRVVSARRRWVQVGWHPPTDA